MTDGSPNPVPRWLHRWAVITVCAALPPVMLGAEVTTKQVGMADPQSVRTPWYLLTIPMPELLERGIGYVIEHSHRLAGWTVGLCAIVLAIGMAIKVRHSRVRWLGLLALVMVSAQGILGIFRVKLHAFAGPDLAMFHGLFAQLVVATLFGVAVVTSPTWWQAVGSEATAPGPRRLGLALTALIYVQVFFGALVRHFQFGAAQRLHALTAFAVVVLAVWLVRTLWSSDTCAVGLRRAAICLVGLLGLQVALGVEAWIGRFGAGMSVELVPSKPGLDFVRSAHYLVGTLLFSISVVLNLLLVRPTPAAATDFDMVRRDSKSLPVSVGGVA